MNISQVSNNKLIGSFQKFQNRKLSSSLANLLRTMWPLRTLWTFHKVCQKDISTLINPIFWNLEAVIYQEKNILCCQCVFLLVPVCFLTGVLPNCIDTALVTGPEISSFVGKYRKGTEKPLQKKSACTLHDVCNRLHYKRTAREPDTIQRVVNSECNLFEC